jgi:hypothetical protein
MADTSACRWPWIDVEAHRRLSSPTWVAALTLRLVAGKVDVVLAQDAPDTLTSTASYPRWSPADPPTGGIARRRRPIQKGQDALFGAFS